MPHFFVLSEKSIVLCLKNKNQIFRNINFSSLLTCLKH